SPRRTSMKLRSLLPDRSDVIQGSADLEIAAIAYDSRRVERGTLFVARPGFETDGHRFIPQALEASATALLVQQDHRNVWEPLVAGSNVAVAVIDDTRRALADVAAAFYDYPARALRVVGVTGTKGKTTTSYLAAALLEASGHRTGLVSGVEIKIGERMIGNDSEMTTPEALEVQSYLAQMRDEGAQYAVVESTSHGLALHRLEHLEYDVAAFTNLYPDHLDFHPDVEDYTAAKGRLFEMLDESLDKGIEKTAVLNADDATSERMRARTKRARALTYGIEAPDADVRAADVAMSERGTRFQLVTPVGACDVQMPLLGLFSVSNALAAATIALSQGATPAAIAAGLAAFRGVPGRMERIDCGQPFAVVVDFAHTGDALRSVLQALRGAARGRLIAVFGAGGDRDPGRRTGMGRAAAELADFAVLTNDNPRTEDPSAIIDTIAAAMIEGGRREGDDFVRIPDRREALRYAFTHAREGDVVLVAGKGHEPYTIIGHEHLPWDDREVAREELRALAAKA
ncbi:MAG: UDP-N-acetylmuramoyl-L-alanyl-D-glutamate--2,6-diaminopimelate ligase, partial [Dehalococcoidia bacterium]